MAARKKQDGGLDQSIESFRASLERSVTVSRERLQEVLDDAVDRGRMTRRDAETVVGELLERGRRQRDNLLEELERLGKQLGKQSEHLARHAREVTEKPLAKAERKLRQSRAKSAPATGEKPVAEPAPKPATAPTPKAKAPAKQSGAKAAATPPFPIADYDALNAVEARKSLADLDPTQLRVVREREAAGAGRKTVLAAIDKKLERIDAK